MARTLNIYKKIIEFRERYYRALPGKESLLKMIAEAEIPEQVYNSNAIENSTITLEETEKSFSRSILTATCPSASFLKRKILRASWNTSTNEQRNKSSPKKSFCFCTKCSSPISVMRLPEDSAPAKNEYELVHTSLHTHRKFQNS